MTNKEKKTEDSLAHHGYMETLYMLVPISLLFAVHEKETKLKEALCSIEKKTSFHLFILHE